MAEREDRKTGCVVCAPQIRCHFVLRWTKKGVTVTYSTLRSGGILAWKMTLGVRNNHASAPYLCTDTNPKYRLTHRLIGCRSKANADML